MEELKKLPNQLNPVKNHRVDLEPNTKPLTIFIPGPFGLRKEPRSEYGIDFKIINK